MTGARRRVRRRDVLAAVTALGAVLLGSGCGSRTPEELTFEEACSAAASATYDVTATVGESAPGVTWAEQARFLDQDKSYSVYARPAVPGAKPEEGWELVDDVVLAPGAPRVAGPLDLAPGTWQVAVTFHDPSCGESDLCTAAHCPAAEVVATRPG